MHGRRYPIGAEVTADGVSFRVWAPDRQRVSVVVADPAHSTAVRMHAESSGHFSALVLGLKAGCRYQFQLDDDPKLYPDPVSRFQPDGPHGPSQVIDHRTFPWTDQNWRGIDPKQRVVYELHIGTFTPEGTWAAAAEKLAHLADVGVTLIEMMPVADFAGTFGWGYDGVDMFAPTRLYGTPDGLRRFVDQAHALQIGVILDVVYNHIGPDGNYLPAFSRHYFTDRHETDWGEALNYDGKHSEGLREFVVTNAAYWIDEFHMDGLRLDATQNIYDSSSDHIVAALARAAREAAGNRTIYIVAENEPQDVRYVREFGVDALWNDDFHHSARVALTGHAEAYYTDYRGTPQEFVSSLKYGYLYQGQWYSWQKQPRGTASLNIEATHFVNFLENHDQIANSGFGLRTHQLSSPGRHRAMTALLLLGPATPMLFQGQEFSATSQFLFFADHQPELAELVRKGRSEFLSQFPSAAAAIQEEKLDDPCSRATFEKCRLKWDECERHTWSLALHRDLLKLRREDPVLSRQSRNLDGAVLAPEAFAIRFFDDAGADRLLIVNLEADCLLCPAPEPLLAPPAGRDWELIWSSEHPRYGGAGAIVPPERGSWKLQGQSAVLIAATKPRKSANTKQKT